MRLGGGVNCDYRKYNQNIIFCEVFHSAVKRKPKKRGRKEKEGKKEKGRRREKREGREVVELSCELVSFNSYSLGLIYVNNFLYMCVS